MTLNWVKASSAPVSEYGFIDNSKVKFKQMAILGKLIQEETLLTLLQLFCLKASRHPDFTHPPFYPPIHSIYQSSHPSILQIHLSVHPSIHLSKNIFNACSIPDTSLGAYVVQCWVISDCST